MPWMPRLALATPALGPDPSVAGLALLAGLTELGITVQHFRARACPVGSRIIGEVTGLPGRHLDSWLMPPDVCRGIFARGASRARLAIVEGTLEAEDDAPRSGGPACPCHQPGALGPLVEALDLPVVAVVPCARLEGFHLPRLPARADAILLDGLECRDDFHPLRRTVEVLTGLPVVGAVEALPGVREALATDGQELPPEPSLTGRLARSFLRFADEQALSCLARSRPMPPSARLPYRPGGRPFRVAYAHDDAFGSYFPDTLETLETLGAELIEFSPLHDPDPPAGADLIMIGCGFSDEFADELFANANMTSTLRAMVCRGTRIYAEGGGAAYLARQIVLEGDRSIPGAGILPVDAVRLARPESPYRVERTFSRASWLGPAGSAVRGYHSGRWAFRPAPEPGDCPAKSGPLTPHRDVYFRRNAIGSLIHLHLAALPEVVEAFTGCARSGVLGP
jgi:cobyrinic acid a,c-diamide synthase